MNCCPVLGGLAAPLGPLNNGIFVFIDKPAFGVLKFSASQYSLVWSEHVIQNYTWYNWEDSEI